MNQGIFTAVILLLISYGNLAFAQTHLPNKYGLNVVKDITILKQQINLDSNKRLVELNDKIPGITLDIKYTTKDNFTKKKLYPPIKTTFLRKPAADSLLKIVSYLKTMGLGIKIFDAYRPYSVTEKMWEVVPDDRYAADPAKGSGHNRGASIDLTLTDLATKKELPMPTGYDDFNEKAHQGYTQLPEEIIKNRETLKSVMELFGFTALKTEWWHFYLPNSSYYELMDLSFGELNKMNSND